MEIKTWSNARKMFTFFTIIAIVIAIVGIFGLVVFTTQRKIKEIGIRKVQGATIFQVFCVVTREFIVLLLMADLMVYPIFPIMANTTPGAYKYTATVWDVVTVFLITLLIVFISSGFQAYRAARRNPVEALRYE